MLSKSWTLFDIDIAKTRSWQETKAQRSGKRLDLPEQVSFGLEMCHRFQTQCLIWKCSVEWNPEYINTIQYIRIDMFPAKYRSQTNFWPSTEYGCFSRAWQRLKGWKVKSQGWQACQSMVWWMVPIDVSEFIPYSCIELVISQNKYQTSDINQLQKKVKYISIKCISFDTVAGLLSFSDNSWRYLVGGRLQLLSAMWWAKYHTYRIGKYDR